MNKISCNIIRDLLPAYLDKLTGKESNELVEMHLAECDECKKLVFELSRVVKVDAKDANREIDYLKKIKDKRKKLLLLTALSGTLIFTAIAVIGIKTFIIGAPISFFRIDYNKDDAYVGIGTDFNTESNELTIYGELLSEQLEVRRVKVEPDKTLAAAYNVTIYGAPTLFLGTQRNGSFREVIKIPDDNARWTVYSMGSDPHDVMLFWTNEEFLAQKYAKPLEKLTEYLTEYLAVRGGAFSENSRIDYSHFEEISGEPCYVFYMMQNANDWEDDFSTVCAVSENGEYIFLHNREQDKWELQGK